MLTIDGYSSLYEVSSVAQRVVSAKMGQIWKANNWDQPQPNNGGQPGSDEEGRRWIYRHRNTKFAARFLAYDVIRHWEQEQGNRVKVIRPDGAIFAIPAALIGPRGETLDRDGEYTKQRYTLQRQGLIDRVERAFGLGTFRQDFWVECFGKEDVFDDESPRLFSNVFRSPTRYLSFIDWDVGCVDLTRLGRLVTAVDHMQKAHEAMMGASVDPPINVKRLQEQSDYSNELNSLFKMLGPFDGCAVMLPQTCVEKLISLYPTKADAVFDEAFASQPREAILLHIEADNLATKADIKAKVLEDFPKMSHRAFERYWSALAEEIPGIRKPGRKSRRRIDTEN